MHLIAFHAEPLGWLAVAWHGRRVSALTLGHAAPDSAERALRAAGYAGSSTRALDQLAKRLQGYAAGEPDDFADVPLDLEAGTRFRRHVLLACQRISYGQTRSYAELAAEVGSPGAARAVGNVMARNRIPILIPCHRVLGCGGRMCGYSAPGGLATKRKLLAIERQSAGRAHLPLDSTARRVASMTSL